MIILACKPKQKIYINSKLQNRSIQKILQAIKKHWLQFFDLDLKA